MRQLVDDAINDKKDSIKKSKSMPKWVVQTLRDDKLGAPLPYCTHVGSHHASYINDCYALVASLCNEEKLVTFNEAQK